MIRMRMVALFAAAAVGVSMPATVEAQGRRDDYARSQKFLGEEIKKLAYDGQIDAHCCTGRLNSGISRTRSTRRNS